MEGCTQISVYDCPMPCKLLRELIIRQAEGNLIVTYSPTAVRNYVFVLQNNSSDEKKKLYAGFRTTRQRHAELACRVSDQFCNGCGITAQGRRGLGAQSDDMVLPFLLYDSFSRLRASLLAARVTPALFVGLVRGVGFCRYPQKVGWSGLSTPSHGLAHWPLDGA